MEPVAPPSDRSTSPRRFWSKPRAAVLGLALTFVAGSAVFALTYSPAPPIRPVANTDGEHSPADAAFLQDMIVHHRQAVEMSQILLDKPDVPFDVRRFASEIVRVQSLQIEGMEETLERWNLPTDPGPVAMEWMGAPVSPAEMHGMASPAELDRLRQAQGDEAASLFLALMSRHHLGGAIMGEAIAERGTNPGVTAFGDRSARYQRVEIVEFGQAREREDLALPPGFTSPPSLAPGTHDYGTEAGHHHS